MKLASTNSGGTVTLGNITITGDLKSVSNANVTNTLIVGNAFSTKYATVSSSLNACTAIITSGTVTSLTTQTITTGGTGIQGSLTGTWTIIGNTLTGGNAFSVQSGNISFPLQSVHGIRCDNYMTAAGTPFNPSGTYTNANVFNYLTGTNGVSQFTGNIAPNKITTNHIAGGGDIDGTWTLTNGSTIQATYADLAERYAADAEYDVGTVVEIGGEQEITAVKDDLSSEVFGVVSNSYAHLLNSAAGPDSTHPPIALVGRIKVKTIGQVCKGQRLVSAGNGVARGAIISEITPLNVIGRALEHKTTEAEELLLATVIIK